MSNRYLITICLIALVFGMPKYSYSQTTLKTDELHESKSLEILPFELLHKRPVVPVLVNYKGPFKFAIDLGATGVGRIDTALISLLGLTITGTTQNYDGIHTRTENITGIESIKLGELEFNDVDLMTRNYNSHDGLLGRDFFADKLLTINYQAKQIYISNSELDVKKVEILAYETPFIVTGSVGNISTEFYLDTGSSLPLLIPTSFLQENDLSYENTGNVYKARRANTMHDINEAHLKEDVQIGEITLRDQLIFHSDIVNRINFGGEVLKDFILTIDPKNKLILLQRRS